jgi:hypothetical protein
MNNEWRISQTAIEAEMLRLAALISLPSRFVPARFARLEAGASNRALRIALRGVAQVG